MEEVLSMYPQSVREDAKRLHGFLEKCYNDEEFFKKSPYSRVDEIWVCCADSVNPIKKDFLRATPIIYKNVNFADLCPPPFTLRAISMEEAVETLRRFTNAAVRSSYWCTTFAANTMPGTIAAAIVYYAESKNLFSFKENRPTREALREYVYKIRELFIVNKKDHGQDTETKIDTLKMRVPQEVLVGDFVPYVMSEFLCEGAPNSELEKESLENLGRLLRGISKVDASNLKDNIEEVANLAAKVPYPLKSGGCIVQCEVCPDDFRKVVIEIKDSEICNSLVLPIPEYYGKGWLVKNIEDLIYVEKAKYIGETEANSSITLKLDDLDFVNKKSAHSLLDDMKRCYETAEEDVYYEDMLPIIFWDLTDLVHIERYSFFNAFAGFDFLEEMLPNFVKSIFDVFFPYYGSPSRKYTDSDVICLLRKCKKWVMMTRPWRKANGTGISSALGYIARDMFIWADFIKKRIEEPYELDENQLSWELEKIIYKFSEDGHNKNKDTIETIVNLMFVDEEYRHDGDIFERIRNIQIATPKKMYLRDIAPSIIARITADKAPYDEKKEIKMAQKHLFPLFEKAKDPAFAKAAKVFAYINQEIEGFSHAGEIKDFGTLADDYSKIYFKVKGCSSDITIDVNTKEEDIFPLLRKRIADARKKQFPFGGIIKYKNGSL